MSDAILELVMKGVEIIDLGRPMFVGMPQSPNHPAYWHSHPRRHGDAVRVDGGSAANDLIVTGTHVGTHVDALAHVSHDGCLHGGVDASAAVRGGRYMEHGVHTVEPMVCRGVLLDVPSALGIEACPPGYEIVPDDLEAAAGSAGVKIRPGDVVLIRSGWGALFDTGPASYLGHESGVPGVAESGAIWLSDANVFAAGADTIAFERVAPGQGHAILPAHRVLLVDSGIYIIEALDLEGLAALHCYEFTFLMAPLRLIGATGSPVRPLALLARQSNQRTNG